MAESSNLHLDFEVNDAGGTILRVQQQQPPWRVVRGFRTASGETLAHVHNLSGGILDTDCLSWRVDVGPRAQAQVTSTGATRVYRSRSLDRRASQRLRVKVASDAYLEYLPDQLIPFAGSRFDQTTRVEIERGGSLIWCDRVAPGREASDEIFRFESLTSHFELIVDGQPVATEHWTLSPLTQRLDSVARLGAFRHFASCYVCKAGEPASYWKTFEAQMQPVAEQVSGSEAARGSEVIWGVTSLRAQGLVIRGLAVSGRSLASGLVEIWKAAKWLLCGRVATLPRKVH